MRSPNHACSTGSSPAAASSATPTQHGERVRHRGPYRAEHHQRLVEAYTGPSLRLFRAPYFGDAEPTTSDELHPAWLAQGPGYLNVGLHVDPGDWQRPGAQAIVDRTLAQVADGGTGDRSTRIVLLHDGGGDRAETVAALPAIIDGLRARGLTLVPISRVAGLPPSQVMPPVTG